MKKDKQVIAVRLLEPNTGQLDWLPRNPRQWTREDVARTAQSIEEDPDFLEDRPLLVVPHGKKWVVFAGNLRREGCLNAGLESVPCVTYQPEDEADQLTIKRRAMKDNGSFGSWDYDELANAWDDLPLEDWGLDVPGMEEAFVSADEIERKKREFEERMRAGEISEEDEEYQAFLEKFQLKKTTDDCYTPEPVYEAVAQWVSVTYKLDRAKFVRPFYPGGDYEAERYAKDAVVVDNPPFSILSEILNFYKEKGVKFFLFAPTLTLFSSSSSSSSTALPCGVAVTYENGASVNTSFLTNLEDKAVRLRSAPSLYKAVKEGNDQNLRELHKELPRYSYDHHIITAPWVGALSRLGIPFSVPVSESEPISHLDAQKESGKAIYGKGYIVGDRVFAEREKAEREKAEREKAEREKAERWTLSPREMEIVKRLTP